jgi:hypothetical protein
LAIFVRIKNMNKGHKDRYNNCFTCLLLTILITFLTLQAWGINGPLISHVHSTGYDTIPKPLPAGDSLKAKVDTFTLKKVSKDSLDAQVQYEAEDSMVLDVPTKTITLYNKTKITYKDILLESKFVKVDNTTQTLLAYPGTDSTGAYEGRPHFVQGESKIDSDTMRYNFKTGKGLTKGSYTQSGELFVYSEKSKRIDSKTFFGLNSNLTTCNLDTPHFAFKARRIKVINGKWGFSGPVHPEFEGVPIPIWLPFGIFPLNKGRHSGFIAPTFSPTEDFGIGLVNGGYYHVLNDYFDLRTTVDIYSYGSWNLYLNPTYRKRYKYNGGLNITLRNTKLNFPGEENYTRNRSFGVQWTHTADTRSRPGVNFNANVNFVSNKNFNYYNPLVPLNNFNNQFSSSIAYSKTWQGKPFSLNITANHSQNTQTRIINLDLPTVGFNVNNIFPFENKKRVGAAKWYEKISVGYQGLMLGRMAFYDTSFTFSRLIDTLRWGAQHNVPLQISLPPMGVFQITPNITYQERWYDRKLYRVWNPGTRKEDTTVSKGFYRAGFTSFGLSVNTQVFGTYQFTDTNAKFVAIRHVIRPQLSFSYQPSLNSRNYYNVQVDTSGRIQRVSYFSNALYGTFSEQVVGGIGFGIDNFLEAKVREGRRGDTARKEKKISLIDGFGFTGFYDLLADSLNLSDINFTIRSNLFQKVNITSGFTLIPYILDGSDKRTRKYAWQGGKFNLGTVSNAYISLSTSFQSKSKKPEADLKKNVNRNQDYPMTLDEQQRLLDQVQRNPGEYADFDVPWSLNLSYSLNMNRVLRGVNKGAYTNVTQSMTVGGDFNFAPKWKMGANAILDVSNKNIQTLTTFLTRDMHCWQLSINITPVGLWRSFNITINPKSMLLRDLRINRTRVFTGF